MQVRIAKLTSCMLLWSVLAMAAEVSSPNELAAEGKDAFRAGRYGDAIAKLESAAGGYLSPEQVRAYVNSGKLPAIESLETTLVYLAVAYARTGREDEARRTILRVGAAEEIERRYARLPLPAEVAEFEPLAARLTELNLPANVQLAAGGAMPQPRVADATQPASAPPPVSSSSISQPPVTPVVAPAPMPVPPPPAPQPRVAEAQPSVVQPAPVPVPAPVPAPIVASTPASVPTPAPQPRVAEAQPAIAQPAPAPMPAPAPTPIVVSVPTPAPQPRVAEAQPAIVQPAPAPMPAPAPTPIVVSVPTPAPQPRVAEAQPTIVQSAPTPITDNPITDNRTTDNPITDNRASEAPRVATRTSTTNSATMAMVRQANDLTATGDFDGANAIYRRLAAAPDASRDVLAAAATGFYRTSDFRDAVDVFDRIGTFARGEEDLRYYRAVALFESGRYADAQKELACALPYIQITDEVSHNRAKIELMAAAQTSASR